MKHWIKGLSIVLFFTLLAHSQEQLPPFSFPDFEGNTHSSEEFKGKPVLIDMWATWCVTCAKSIPLIKKIEEEFGPKGLQVIGVSIDSKKGRNTTKFIQKYQMNYLLLWDKDNTLSQPLQFEAIPSFFLFDAEGKLLFAMRGYDEAAEKELLTVLKSLFKG